MQVEDRLVTVVGDEKKKISDGGQGNENVLACFVDLYRW